METIWQGDVKQFSGAYDLICIVDQIHDYAVNNHRELIMKHLEAWHVRHEKNDSQAHHLLNPFMPENRRMGHRIARTRASRTGQTRKTGTSLMVLKTTLAS